MPNLGALEPHGAIRTAWELDQNLGQPTIAHAAKTIDGPRKMQVAAALHKVHAKCG